jgi:hypothetical protein
MIKFHNNRELSQLFGINLAKWKRWSREFLPPDPLGGLQSGYARQYNPDEAFTIYLGGHLVGKLKFSIPEARKILHDLQQWLLDHDFYFDFSGKANPLDRSIHQVKNYQIEVIDTDRPEVNLSGLRYRVKATISSDSLVIEGVRVHQERFIKTSISLPGPDNEPIQTDPASCRLINISILRQSFLDYFTASKDRSF